MWIHLTARASAGRPLAESDNALWLWHALRRRWPDALAACLMPDHPHLLISSRDPDRDRLALAHLLGGFSRRVEPVNWGVAPSEVIQSAEHARRTVRYILLNPCRARLTDDPLAWRWSTHAGLVGAHFDPWVTADRLATALGEPRADFARKLHRYVTGDPSVASTGSAFPSPAPRRDRAEVPVSAIIAAARAATPWCNAATFHHAAVLLSRHQAWDGSSVVAEALGISPRTVRRLASRPAPVLLAAAAMCLGDERLRRDASAVLRVAGRTAIVDDSGARLDASAQP